MKDGSFRSGKKYNIGEMVIVKGKGDARIDDYNVSENTYRVSYDEKTYEWVKAKDITLPG